jgi:uncharacterized protein (DUF2147 family)
MAYSAASATAMAAALCVALGPAPAGARVKSASRFPFGTWENAKHTVRVKIERCGPRACGRVVWASEDAKADAERGGTPNLIGVQLFRDLAEREDGVWAGKIFVPDLNGVFDGAVRADGPEKLTAEGCVAKLVCKTQVWTRLSR